MRGRQPSNLVDAEILVGCKDAAEELGIDVKPMMPDCGIDPELMLAPAGPLKREFARWMLRGCHRWSGLKGLRCTLLDIFAHTAERRTACAWWSYS